jgi:putative spermidine/putrescine transport system substrate-binding protein
MVGILVAGIVGMFQFTTQSAAAGDQLVVCSWGGAYTEAQKAAYYDTFEKETGIKVIAVGPPTTAKIKAMVETGNAEWDIADIDAGMALIAMKYGCLEKIDYSGFSDKLKAELMPGTMNEYMCATMHYGMILAYRTDVFTPDKAPKNWSDFWNVKDFPGPRCWMSGKSTGANLELALAADGVPVDKLYPIDIDRAFKVLDRIRPHVVKWWETGSVPPQLLTDKEVVMTSAYHGRITKIIEEGAPVAIEWNQGLLDTEYWTIIKGTKNYKNALRFIEFASRAENQAKLVEGYPAGPVNKRAFDFIPEKRKKLIPTSPENYKKMIVRNNNWWADNREKVNEKWTTWAIK